MDSKKCPDCEGKLIDMEMGGVVAWTCFNCHKIICWTDWYTGEPIDPPKDNGET